MNKKTIMSFIAFAGTFAVGLVALHIMLLFDISKWVGVSVGIALLIIALVAFCISKKSAGWCVAAIILNALGDGIAASSLFVHIGVTPEVWKSAVCFAVMCAAFLVYCLLTNIGFISEHPVIFTVSYLAVLLAVLITLTVLCAELRPTCYIALLFFVIFIAYLISTAIDAYDVAEQFKTLAYCSFTALAIIIIVVLIVLSEGDFAPDFGGGGGGKPKKKRNHYKFN